MKTILNVLIPTDFSPNAQNAIKYGLEFIDKFKCNLFLQHVYEPYEIATEVPMVEMIEKENNEKIFKIKNELEKTVKNIVKTKPQQLTNCIISQGDAATEIIETAQKRKIDLIIMGNTSKSPINRLMLGNITNKIMENSPCPVLIIPPHCSFHELKNMAYAAILTETDLWKINQLTAIGTAFGASLHVIHINKTGKGNGQKDLKEFKKNSKSNINYEKIFFESIEAENISEGIEDYIHTHQIDLFSMSTRTRMGLQKLFNSSVSEKVSSNIEVPLLIFHYNKED